MFTRLTRTPLRAAVLIVIVAALVGMMIAPVALARIMGNTIDPVAIVADDGRHLIVTGPIECTENQRAYVRVTVTSRLTGAVAEGRTVITCTGEGNPQQWEVHAATQGKESFQEGPATAVGLARTTDRGDTTDAHQWLVPITLVR